MLSNNSTTAVHENTKHQNIFPPSAIQEKPLRVQSISQELLNQVPPCQVVGDIKYEGKINFNDSDINLQSIWDNFGIIVGLCLYPFWDQLWNHVHEN